MPLNSIRSPKNSIVLTDILPAGPPEPNIYCSGPRRNGLFRTRWSGTIRAVRILETEKIPGLPRFFLSVSILACFGKSRPLRMRKSGSSFQAQPGLRRRRQGYVVVSDLRAGGAGGWPPAPLKILSLPLCSSFYLMFLGQYTVWQDLCMSCKTFTG